MVPELFIVFKQHIQASNHMILQFHILQCYRRFRKVNSPAIIISTLCTELEKRNRINSLLRSFRKILRSQEYQTHKKEVLNHVCRFHIRFRSTLWKNQLSLGISVPEQFFHIINNFKTTKSPVCDRRKRLRSLWLNLCFTVGVGRQI